jgi:DNA-binding NarL/FixJ family response regulator
MSSGESVARRAIETVGAYGFVSQRWKVDEIIAAIRIVGLGMRLDRVSAEQVRPGPNVTLTRREEHVLTLIATGATNVQIAAELSLSVYTIKQHAHAAYRKLDARNRTVAVQRAQRLGVIC